MRFSDQVPARFQPAVRTVERLAEDDGCLAALLFGSIARGEAADDSDVDVHVVSREANPCREINHPVVGDEIYNEGRDKTVADLNIRKAISSLGRFFLHAERLSFMHPKTQERMEFKQEMPAELKEFLDLL